MSVPRQQPHAIAKFKHQHRTAVPKPVTTPVYTALGESWCEEHWHDFWPGAERRMTDSERKRNKARAARKARK